MFLFPNPLLHKLYHEIKQAFDTVRRDDIYYISLWLNVHRRGQDLPWHSHNPPEHQAFHGFYAVNAEPSVTEYRFPDGSTDNVVNKNNQLVISLSGSDEHKVSTWEYDEPRITVAFDIIPYAVASENFTRDLVDNWMPI
jgi:hypothetical protein